ncbi:MAG: DUF4405 domain-containing protein [Anaerolineaceae bacterium]|nr:DUF4405 domain-containing protein [Anaerolineaceae bacterium]
MSAENVVKKQKSFWSTKRRWVVDAVLGLSAVVVIASGIYFLYLPAGYQGGRNPYYDMSILFSRQTWDLLHTWSGILMILIALVHIAVHWKWFLRMGRRTWQQIRGQKGKLNPRGRINLWANFILAASFVLCSLSGVYFMFVSGSRQAVDPGILFSRFVWDMIHTWSGILMIVAALAHFVIHWKWVINNAERLLRSISGLFRRSPSHAGETTVKA